ESVSISACRNNRGEPHAEQRLLPSATSHRQSRQKPGIVPPCGPTGSASFISWWRLPCPVATAKRVARANHLIGIGPGLRCKAQQEALVPGNVVENSGKKIRLA